MILTGAEYLNASVESVNALNVFPVPDGDTGTNMNMTLASGAEELKKKQFAQVGKAAEALSKGLLMGARGNSGVILSQLFRGFAKSVQDKDQIDVQQFAAALQQGVDMAYKAVVKPVEGTILTVAREAAKHAVASAKRCEDLAALMEEVLAKAKETLAKTPEQLPVLKQVGVVDAGGQGLVCIYEGFLAALGGEAAGPKPVREPKTVPDAKAAESGMFLTELPGHGDHRLERAQVHLSTEEIEYGYCTEFIVRIVPEKTAGAVFEEAAFRSELEKHGDSVLVVSDDELVKVHIHAEYPGNVLTLGQRYGDLVKIKIENMREQHSHILEEERGATARTSLPESVADEAARQAPPEAAAALAKPAERPRETPALKPFGFVAVASGDGLVSIMTSLGADVVISGGQTMNPSTEDIVKAIERVQAETVFVLPNNSNIIMASQQASELLDRNIVVIPTKTIPQGMAALIAFNPKASAEQNVAAMERAIRRVQSGQVTYAVRNSRIDGMDIKEGDYIGIHNNRIVVSNPDLLESCRKLVDSMMAEGGEVITILTGADANEAATLELVSQLEEAYPDAELEVHIGGQPVYYYLISVE
jgi:hypothetical protein